MYNIVIADDEQLECMVLRQSLEEYLGGRCFVRVATNGREAVETALSAEADLVIMDIEMPGMKGLEAARIISQKLPDCKIIMLTAYSEFKYAREAISFGSSEYLLKPCSDDDLHRALDRVLPQIDRRLAGEKEKARSMERIATLSSQIEEQIVLALMGGDINPEYIMAQMRTYGVEFCNGVFAILYASDTGNSKVADTALKSSPWPERIHPFLYRYDDRIYIVSVSSGEDVDSLAATMAHIASLSKTVGTLWGRPIFGGLGRSFSNLRYAQLSCFQAQTALGKCVSARPVCAYNEENESEPSEYADNPLINSILFGDVEEIGRVSSGLISALLAQQLDFEAVINRLNAYLAKIIQSLRRQTGFAIADIVINPDKGQADIESLIYNTASEVCKLTGHLSALMETKGAGNLQKVKSEIEKYVAMHYSEDLFLPGIAREINYSSAYFSRLFKQCFQCNFITYLTDVRIRAAKDLMQNTDKTIREIGEKVGYKDSNYFTKVFRKVEGVSPSEYRMLDASRDGVW